MLEIPQCPVTEHVIVGDRPTSWVRDPVAYENQKTIKAAPVLDHWAFTRLGTQDGGAACGLWTLLLCAQVPEGRHKEQTLCPFVGGTEDRAHSCSINPALEPYLLTQYTGVMFPTHELRTH
jgi:hypothetical protein